MRQINHKVFFTSTILFVGCRFCFGEPITTNQVVGPDVTWIHQSLTEGPLNYNILRVNLANPLVTIETESGHDSLYAGEKVLESAQREAEPGRTEIVGGVNADFWVNQKRSFTPQGLLVADGMIYNMPSQKRSSFVLTKDERPYIGKVTLNVTLQNKTRKLPIANINSPSPGKYCTLYTLPYGNQVGPSPGNRFILEMQNKEFLPNQPIQVKVKEVDSSTTTSLSKGTMVLHISPGVLSGAGWISNGSSLTLSAMLPEVMGVVASVCGGGPVIVQDGKPKIADEGISKTFIETKHPRTAIGITKDGNTVFFLTVDGRQPKISVGASLPELGSVMAKLGCWRAMNLDGGGSSTMVVNNKVVNKPCDLTGPRTVANSLLIVAKASVDHDN